MGGIIKAITPPSPKPSQTQSQAQVAQQVQQQTATATAQAAAAESERRKEALVRQRSGRAGTIATSSRGLLTAADWLPARKSLLGE